MSILDRFRIPGRVAVITGAGKMPIKHVIHAVGPRMGEGDEDRKLAAAVKRHHKRLRSQMLPAKLY